MNINLSRMLLMLLCSASVNGAEIDELSSRFGKVEVVRSLPDGPPDTISVNGKSIFTQEDFYVGLIEKFELESYDALLFGVNCGGTGCPNDELSFLILTKNEPPKVITSDKFYSLDGTVESESVNGRVVVDLGYDDGRLKRAILNLGKVEVTYSEAAKKPLEKDDCKWLHEYSMNECVAFKQSYGDCQDPWGKFSGVTMRGVAAISNHPGFGGEAFDSSCLKACDTGRSVDFREFEVKICGAK